MGPLIRRQRRMVNALELSNKGQSAWLKSRSHNPAAVHAPSSGYSMGLKLGQHRRLLFISGQVPDDRTAVCRGFEAQYEQKRRNIIEVPPPASASSIWSRSIVSDRPRPGRAQPRCRRKMLSGHEPASGHDCRTVDANGCWNRGRRRENESTP
jgi:hypothetical protein